MPARFPFASFPTGWFAVRPSAQLRPRQLEPVHYFGRDMVLYRTESGKARLTEPVCPHLGANLALGRVCGENLVCGMHGFEFGEDGRCVRNAYGTRPPPAARITHHPVHEINGFIFVYYSPDGAPPAWNIEPLDWEGWTRLRHRYLEFVGHLPDSTENMVDMGHFKSVHYYTASVEADPVTDGEKLTASYRVVRPWFGPRLQRLRFDVRFHVLAHGLGYSLIHATVERPPISLRYLANAIPIDGERIHLHLAAAVRKGGVPGLDQVMREVVFQGLCHDVSQDIRFWESKHFLERPLLAEGDGPIGIYRRWCKQFYPMTSQPAQASTAAPTPTEHLVAARREPKAQKSGPSPVHRS